MGTWETTQGMVRRAEVRGWKQPQKTSDVFEWSQRGHRVCLAAHVSGGLKSHST